MGEVIIRKATLFNADYVNKLGIEPGDKVIVERRGDVIPYVSCVTEKWFESRAGRETHAKANLSFWQSQYTYKNLWNVQLADRIDKLFF